MTSDPGALSPKEVANASFDSKRRGYDPAAVDRHLKKAAATVTHLEGEVVSLAARVEALTAEVDAAKAAAAAATQNPIELDDDALTERVGHDAARVLSEARAAAADRLAEAEQEAQQILVKAEEVYAARSQEADEEANRIRLRAGEAAERQAEEAHDVAAGIVSAAQADLELARSEVYSDRENADAEAAQIVREAELARRQILGDLLRRRGAAKRQIEQLRAGRERLLASHETVRRALDEITEELAISMSEARAAAKTAGHSLPDGTIEELEAEIETARLTGLLDTGPVPVVRSPALPTSSSANQPPAEAKSTDTESTDTESSDSATADAAESTNVASVDDVDDVASTPTTETAETPPVKTPIDEASVAEATGAGDDAEAADESSSADSSSADTSGDLAEVVQLDKARAEVDTASHPAKGREAGNGRSNGASVKADTPEADTAPTNLSAVGGEPEAKDPKTDSNTDEVTAPAKLAAAPDPVVSLAADDSVGDLFASLRSDNEQLEPPVKKTPPKKNIASAKSTSTTKAPQKKAKQSKKAKAQPLVDSSELARRLKRVLADEQSRAMSQIKNAESLPDLTGLLYAASEHRLGYWNEVLDQLDDPGLAGSEASAAIDDLVETIRRRVGEALTSADGDAEAAVASLRSIYREIKTQQIGQTADSVSNGVLAPS